MYMYVQNENFISKFHCISLGKKRVLNFMDENIWDKLEMKNNFIFFYGYKLAKNATHKPQCNSHLTIQ